MTGASSVLKGDAAAGMFTAKLEVVVSNKSDRGSEEESLRQVQCMVRKLVAVDNTYLGLLGWIDITAGVVMLLGLVELVMGVLSYKITLQRFSLAEASFGLAMLAFPPLHLRLVQRQAARFGQLTAYLRLFIYSKIDPSAPYGDVLGQLRRKYLPPKAGRVDTSTLGRDAALLCDATLARAVEEHAAQPGLPARCLLRAGRGVSCARRWLRARPLHPLPQPLEKTYFEVLEGYQDNFASKVEAWLAERQSAQAGAPGGGRCGPFERRPLGAAASSPPQLSLTLYVPASREDLEAFRERRLSELLAAGERHAICAIDAAALAATHRTVFYWTGDPASYFDLVRTASSLLLPRYQDSLATHIFIFKRSLEELVARWRREWQAGHPGARCPAITVQDFRPAFAALWNAAAPAEARLP